MNSVANALETVLADTYALLLKTHNYHWNVEGSNFKALHEMFQSQYEDLFEAADGVAELIRTLGEKTIGTFDDFARLTNIKNGNKDATAEQMLFDLLHDHESIVQAMVKASAIAQKAGEEVTVAFLGDRMATHKKTAWMLRSTLAK
jgi:starvation-inducible DNA-binding protein